MKDIETELSVKYGFQYETQSCSHKFTKLYPSFAEKSGRLWTLSWIKSLKKTSIIPTNRSAEAKTYLEGQRNLATIMTVVIIVAVITVTIMKTIIIIIIIIIIITETTMGLTVMSLEGLSSLAGATRRKVAKVYNTGGIWEELNS